jgi:hypothetical protein
LDVHPHVVFVERRDFSVIVKPDFKFQACLCFVPPTIVKTGVQIMSISVRGETAGEDEQKVKP